MNNLDGKPVIECFQDDLSAVIEKYMDSGIDLGSAIGAIEICKLDLLENSKENDRLYHIARIVSSKNKGSQAWILGIFGEIYAWLWD